MLTLLLIALGIFIGVKFAPTIRTIGSYFPTPAA